MTGLLHMLGFAVDAALVALTAWLALGVARGARRGLVETTLGWLLLALAWVAGSGVLLGMMGGLGRVGFLTLHAAGFAGLLAVRRGGREDWQHMRDWLGAWGKLLRGGSPEGRLTAVLLVILAGLAVLAARAEPIIYDALTYRLSRIGAWLQDGWIRNYPGDDPRLNYMPVAPDLVIAWLLGATDTGFKLAPLAQLAGGALLLGATFGLARTAGLSRLGALGAVALVLGMANAAAQLTTLQSDLFTAGIFAAAYLLWHRALERGEGSWVAGVGVALAFGSKGTMFYLAPGAALWVGWHAWQHRAHWRALFPTAAGLAVAALVLVGPGWWRNHAMYGSPLGPRDAVILHHGESQPLPEAARKLALNLGTSAVQLLEPNAQPVWLQGASLSLAQKLAARQPGETDAHIFLGLVRRTQVETVLGFREPDADVLTCGLVGSGLFLAGLLAAALGWKRLPGAPQVAVWGLGVALYLVTQHALVQWHVWAFRFVVLVAPWMAVSGAWLLGGLPGKLRVAAWTVALLAAVEVFFTVQVRTSQSAWRASTAPGEAAPFQTYRNWRDWAARLDEPETPLRLACPINYPLAAFYRLPQPRPVVLAARAALAGQTAEAALGEDSGWLIVAIDEFKGREGRVMGRTLLYELAAYRRLREGERPAPILYSHRQADAGESWRRELLVRAWREAPVRIELGNAGDTAFSYVVRHPGGETAGRLEAGAKQIVELPWPADVLAPVTVEYPKAPAPGATPHRLSVRVAP